MLIEKLRNIGIFKLCRLKKLLKNTDMYKKAFLDKSLNENISASIKTQLGIKCKACSCIDLFKNEEELNNFIGNHEGIGAVSLEFHLYLNMAFYLKINGDAHVRESTFINNVLKVAQDAKFLRELTYKYNIEFGIHYIYNEASKELQGKELVRGDSSNLLFNYTIMLDELGFWGIVHTHPRVYPYKFSDEDINYHEFYKTNGFVIAAHILGVHIPDKGIAYLNIRDFFYMDTLADDILNIPFSSDHPPGKNWLTAYAFREKKSVEFFDKYTHEKLEFEEIVGRNDVEIIIKSPIQVLQDTNKEMKYLRDRLWEAQEDDTRMNRLRTDGVVDMFACLRDIRSCVNTEFWGYGDY